MSQPPKKFHSLAEARSLALHQEVAARLEKHPDIVEKAKKRVERWLADPARHPYAHDWQLLLALSIERLASELVSTSSRMCTLRQASPFAGALDNQTRWRILKQAELRSRETS